MATDDGKVGQRGAPPQSWVVDRRQAGSVGWRRRRETQRQTPKEGEAGAMGGAGSPMTLPGRQEPSCTVFKKKECD
jgi:hypothetical protein